MTNTSKMKAALLYLGTNTWREEDNTDGVADPFEVFSPRLRCDKAIWNEYTLYLRECGVNTLIINLGDGFRYDSHPELAVDGAWTVDEMRTEIARLKGLGFELIPMLNFSGAHDIWLGASAHMIATVPYYRVCADRIDEVCAIFEPKYVHIGMDSESFETQKDFFYAVVRHKEQWWHDVYFFTDRIIGNGARAIIYADKMTEGSEAFFKGLPPSVVVSETYNGSEDALARIKTTNENGYDQLPICTDAKALGNIISDGHFLGNVALTDIIFDETRREAIFNAADAVRS